MLLPHAQSSGQGGVWPWLMMECAEQFSYVVLKPLQGTRPVLVWTVMLMLK